MLFVCNSVCTLTDTNACSVIVENSAISRNTILSDNWAFGLAQQNGHLVVLMELSKAIGPEMPCTCLSADLQNQCFVGWVTGIVSGN